MRITKRQLKQIVREQTARTRRRKRPVSESYESYYERNDATLDGISRELAQLEDQIIRVVLRHLRNQEADGKQVSEFDMYSQEVADSVQESLLAAIESEF